MKKHLIALATVALGASCTANAGVYGTAYLSLSQFSIEVQDPNSGNVISDVSNFVEIDSGSRGTAVNAGWNGFALTDQDQSGSDPEYPADAELRCMGPECGLVGLTENTSTGLTSHAFNFSAADAQVSGSLLGGDAAGFTYADAGIDTDMFSEANATSTIGNQAIASTINIAGPISIRFSALVDVLVDAFISDDIKNDNTIDAYAFASASFSATLTPVGGFLPVAGAGGSWADLASDTPGPDALSFDQTFPYQSDWFLINPGQYSLNIEQTSDVIIDQVKVIPEPSGLALMGLSILGLGFAGRRKFK
ncbi:PEP-CTERM sorting domain-containing protein [Alteromonas lipolytica]|uniref:Ice-binding protein C-terminal domain-containing protein n=1 Tax=Alteromonas lipolytica TaxID=1856405 RepID=A0A1E8FDT0_9ALTE|nr:PEP-CTERM sorting domain-containing protein [Alteromonas lipolytica]OFI34080.1 hypothetical protein BFC17_21260 [Alteromonas lipolytica]GGF65590.1 hypothetical protein GCM10011338_17440 [Alteromonas lipolytica]